MKKVIRLTESDIHRIVKNSVKRVLNEGLLDNTKPVAGENLRNVATQIYNTMSQNQDFMRLMECGMNWYQNDDSTQLTRIGTNLFTNLIQCARNNMRY